MSQKVPTAQVVDKNGNPIMISAIVNFIIEDPVIYMIKLRNELQYLTHQSEVVVKKIASKYPYESNDEQNLKNESETINQEMTSELNNRVRDKGILVEDVFISDLNYAPEIAQQMLMKQQAQAFVESKQTITDASIDMVRNVTDELEGILSAEGKEQLTINLLTVLTYSNGTQTTIPLK